MGIVSGLPMEVGDFQGQLRSYDNDDSSYAENGGFSIYSPFPSNWKSLSGALNGAFSSFAQFFQYYVSVQKGIHNVGDVMKGAFNNLEDIIYLSSESFSIMNGRVPINIPFYFIFHPNPTSIDFSYSHAVDTQRSRSWVYPNFKDNGLSISLSGHISTIYTPFLGPIMLRPMRRVSFGYWMMHILRAIYLSNGWNFRGDRKTYFTMPDSIASLKIGVRDSVYEGHITSFSESEDALQPYLIPVNFKFTVFRAWRQPVTTHLAQLISGLPVFDIANTLHQRALSTEGKTKAYDSLFGREV